MWKNDFISIYDSKFLLKYKHLKCPQIALIKTSLEKLEKQPRCTKTWRCRWIRTYRRHKYCIIFICLTICAIFFSYLIGSLNDGRWDTNGNVCNTKKQLIKFLPCFCSKNNHLHVFY